MNKGKYKSAKRKQRKNGPLFPLLLALGGLILIGAAVFALARGGGRPANFTPEVSGAPSLKTDKETVDLGEVPLGKTVKVEYQLTNVGDRTLRLTKDPYIEVVEGC
jgi:hypothetical protein